MTEHDPLEEPGDQSQSIDYYCPQCRRPVADPLVCADCLAVICRVCGSVLEHADELGLG